MILQRAMYKRYLMALVLSGTCFVGFAQQETGQRPAVIDSIDVVRDYRPVLADAVKIRRSPDMTNKREYQPKLTYPIIDKKLNITTGTQQLTIQEMPYARQEDIKPSYIKLGAGNFSTLNGEVYVSTDMYEDARIGGFAKHLNQRGPIEAQKFNHTQLGIFGRKSLPLFTVSGELGYNRYGTSFYGVGADDVSLSPNPDNQAFNDIYLTAELYSNYDDTRSDDISYSFKADGYGYSNAFQARENSIAVSGYVNKQINVFNVGANLSADFTQVEDADYSIGNHIARLNPYFRFQGANYTLTLGANIVSEFGDFSRTNIFPSAEVDFALIPQFAHIFGGINGDVNKTSFRELSKENPFLAPNVLIQNSLDRMNIYGGIKGNAGATFGYKVHAFYRSVEGLPFFQNNIASPYMFDVIYETSESASTVLGLEGEINVRVSETVSLGGKVNFNEFDLETQDEAWFLPKMRVAANTRINISEKVFIDGELLFNGQTYGRVFTVDPADATVLIPSRVTIPTFADISAGAEYRVNNQFGIYIRANNLLGNTYQRYLYYPRLGLNVIGGINFSF